MQNFKLQLFSINFTLYSNSKMCQNKKKRIIDVDDDEYVKSIED